MEVITAVESIVNACPSVFLGGGIVGAPKWQEEIIEILREGRKGGLIYNPRRPIFPFEDPDAAYEQINWEFEALAVSDVFSMWFCAGESERPICMYELGRHLVLREDRTGGGFCHIAIGIEKGYRREADVRIQMGLIYSPDVGRISETLENHAGKILEELARVARKKLGHIADGRL